MPRKTDRVAVRATNHETGELWSIHDSRKVCDAELEKKLAEWGSPGDDTVVTVEWADLDDEPDSDEAAPPAPIVLSGVGGIESQTRFGTDPEE